MTQNKSTLRCRNGRYEGTIHFTDMDPITWRKIERLLRQHSDDKKARKLVQRVRSSQ